MNYSTKTVSLILAAGRGSRMREFEGNKSLLPLIPDKSLYEGKCPMLLHILKSLPSGPKGLVINYKKEDVIRSTRRSKVIYYEQPKLNGTGGALFAAREFLEKQDYDNIVITMGDVPLVRSSTYQTLLECLKDKSFAVLGFLPKSKKKYGVLEIDNDRVRRIIEWKYWHKYSKKRQQAFRVCNSGIYASKKEELLRYIQILASKPHMVQKEINDVPTGVKEYFITDIVKYMADDGLLVGFVIGEDEEEVMGVDDPEALAKVQTIFCSKYAD